MALAAHIRLRDTQRFAAGDADHLAHQVDAGDELGHRMLDLDAGVHLDEIEVAGLVVIEIFERAGAAIMHRLRQRDGGGAQLLPDVVGQHRRGRLFPHLLAAALQRAFALEAMDHALAVAEDLHLDVAGALDHLLQVEPAVAERRLRLGAGLRHQALELLEIGGDADAAATTAGRRLDHDGKAGALDDGARRLGIVDTAVAAGNARHAGCERRLARRHLVAHQADRLRARTDEDEAGIGHRFGKAGILGQEAVAGVHRIGAAALGGIEDGGDVEIGLGGLGRADQHGFVRQLHRQRVRIGGAVDLDGVDAELARGADDADRDLAAIGDEQTLDQGARPRPRPGAGRPSPRPRSPPGTSRSCRRCRPSPR